MVVFIYLFILILSLPWKLRFSHFKKPDQNAKMLPFSIQERNIFIRIYVMLKHAYTYVSTHHIWYVEACAHAHTHTCILFLCLPS